MQNARDNNFNILRMMGSVFIFAGHMEMIRSGSPLLFGIHSLHEMGVWILFLVSGYLVAKSWMSDPNPLRFTVRRFLRLWPPFAVMVLIMAFITGPLLSDLGVKGYFQSSWWYLYLMNLRFYPVYAQPGVFANMIESYVTNGSLWTMPVEVFAYIITPFLMGLYGLGRHKSAKVKASGNQTGETHYFHSASVEESNEHSFHVAAFVTAAAIAFDLYLRLCQAGVSVVFYGTNLLQAWHLLTMYIIGVFFSFEQARKYLNLQVACIGVCLIIIFESSGAFLQYLLLLLVLPYAVFSFAFAPKAAFSRFANKVELSYGIYLYGFFFQQLIVSWQNQHGITLSYTKSLVLSAIPTLIAALLSFYLIEKPAQKLCRSIIAKLRCKEESRIS